MEDFFRDALVNDGSEGSIRQLVEIINSNEFTTGKTNYALTMLAFVKEPTRQAIKELVPLLERMNIPRQGLLGASAMIHNFCENHKGNCEDVREVKDAVAALIKHLGYRCKPESAESADRVIVTLKAIKNTRAVGEDAVNAILPCIGDRSNPNPIRSAALATLRKAANNKRVQEKAWEILEDTKSDAEVRIAAYRVIIKGQPDRSTLYKLTTFLNKEESKQGN